MEELSPILPVFLLQQRGQEWVLPAGVTQRTASSELSRSSLVGDIMEKRTCLRISSPNLPNQAGFTINASIFPS